MRKLLIIISIIVFSKSLSVSPSSPIWNELKNSIANGKIVYDKTHFIFDEKNITGLDIHSPKMEALYQKQKQIYEEDDNLANFIFIIENIDEQYSKTH